MHRNRFVELLDLSFFKRDPTAHKNSYGKAILFGGSEEYPGAISLSALGASMAGPGYVAVNPERSIAEIVKSRTPLTCVFDSDINDISRFDSICFGNGMKNDAENREKLCFICNNLKPGQRLIIDATGIDMFAEISAAFQPFQGNVVLTPHPGEASRLFGISKNEDLIAAAKRYSDGRGLLILLKGYESRLIYPGGESKSSYSGVPSLAKAGSGDVLAGFLAGLSAYLGKYASFQEIVEFGDTLFHLSFQSLEKQLPAGIIHPDDFPEALKLYLKEFQQAS